MFQRPAARVARFLHALCGKHRRASAPRSSPYRPALECLEQRALLSAGYVQTNLTSDIPGLAANTDPALKNPWGIAVGPGPFWLADNSSGLSTLYNGQGQPQPPGTHPPTSPLQVTILPAANSPNGTLGTPTGTVFNGGGGFNVSETVNGSPHTGPSYFLFATQDGLIAGWNPTVDPTHAVIAVDNSASHASYTGLALGTDKAGQPLLYGANFLGVSIDVYDSTFHKVTNLAGSFQDPSLPAGYWPFNIQELGGKLYVTYALPNDQTGEGLPGAGKGIVDVYSNDGVLLTKHHLIANGPHSPLNAPWGLALAPASFGRFSNDLLVGNFGDGHINAFNSMSGAFVGTLTLASGQAFQEDDLWALQFGNDPTKNGPPSTLFFTAGLNNESDGLFGSLQAPATISMGSPVLSKLSGAAVQTVATNAANGDNNPYGLAFVPKNYTGGGALHAGDLLVSNFNSSSGLQGTGTTIMRIAPTGQVSTFFTGPNGLGLTTALGVLSSGFVLVGSVPNDGNGNALQGSLLILDGSGHLVRQLTDSALLNGPWDMTVVDHGTSAQVYVANVLSGTVTRINLSIPKGGTPLIDSETEISAGYTHRSDPNALVVGPTGLAYDPGSGTLYVVSTADNAIYAIAGAATSAGGHTKGRLVVQNESHLHGPLALVIAPNGDLIVSNGDAINPGGTPNDLVEFTRTGRFVADFQVDTGTAGAAFGLALSTDNGVLRFATVDDNAAAALGGSNTVSIFTLGLM